MFKIGFKAQSAVYSTMLNGYNK